MYFENNAEGEKALEAFRTAESEYTQAYPVVMFYQFNCSLFAKQCRQLNMMPPFITMRQGKLNFTIQLPRVIKTPQIKRFIYKVRAPLLDYVRDMNDIQEELSNFKFKQYPCMFEIHAPSKEIGEKLVDKYRGEARFIYL